MAPTSSSSSSLLSTHPTAVLWPCARGEAHPPLGNGGAGDPLPPRGCGKGESSMSGRDLGSKFGLEPDAGLEPGEAWGNAVCAGTWRALALPCLSRMINALLLTDAVQPPQALMQTRTAGKGG